VRTCRSVALSVSLLLISCGALLVATGEADAASPKTQLRQARSELVAACAELRDIKAKLRVAIDTEDRATQRMLAPRYHQLKRRIPALRKKVRRLTYLVEHPMTPGPNGSWWRVIKAASFRHRLNATALQRMMILESGGRADCVSGPFMGLFQYCSSAWSGSWNPYRKYSVFNGGAQIWATATAIHRGYGPQMWPNTYPMAFGNAR
jgi:hypothetical protein